MERIIKIKYNQELLKNQVRLERQLAMVNNELKEVQSTCNHINIILGSDNKYSYKKCLFCEKMVSNNTTLPTLDASKYKEEIYGTGTTQEDRIARLNDLRNIVINLIKEDSNITDEQICKKLEKIIKE